MATTRRAAPVADVDDTPPPPRGADPEAWALMLAQRGEVADMQTPEEAAEEDAAQRVRALLGGNAGDGVRISIYRRTQFRKTLEWCADYSPDQFMEGGLPLIHADLGAGAYEWRAVGRTGVLGRGHFEIAANARATNPTQPAAPAVPDALTRALETIAAGQAAILQTLAAKPDPMADMEKQLRLMTMMREAMGGGAAPAVAVQAPPSLLEQLHTLKALRDFAKDEVTPERETDPDNPMSYIAPIIDMVKEGFKAKQTPQFPAIVEPLPMIGAPASLHGLSAPQQGPAAPSSEPAAGSDSPDGLAWRGIVTEALRMAKAGEPAAAGGRLLFQTLPDEFLPYLRLPNCAEILGSMAPELTPYAAWVEGARVEALRLLDADEAA